MLIVLIAKKDSDSDSGFGLTILEYSRIVNYSELPIPTSRFTYLALHQMMICHRHHQKDCQPFLFLNS